MSAASLVDLTYVVERFVEAMTAEKARYVIGTAARCIIMFIYLTQTLLIGRSAWSSLRRLPWKFFSVLVVTLTKTLRHVTDAWLTLKILLIVLYMLRMLWGKSCSWEHGLCRESGGMLRRIFSQNVCSLKKCVSNAFKITKTRHVHIVLGNVWATFGVSSSFFQY